MAGNGPKKNEFRQSISHDSYYANVTRRQRETRVTTDFWKENRQTGSESTVLTWKVYRLTIQVGRRQPKKTVGDNFPQFSSKMAIFSNTVLKKKLSFYRRKEDAKFSIFKKKKRTLKWEAYVTHFEVQQWWFCHYNQNFISKSNIFKIINLQMRI